MYKNFYLLPQYENDVMVALKRDENYVGLKTYARNAGKSGSFYIDANKLSAWLDNEDCAEFWDVDCGNILRITYDREKYSFTVKVWWLPYSPGKVSGVLQLVEIDAYTFNQALVRTNWTRILCKADTSESVHFIWTESANRVLREIQKNPQMKRALCKAFAKGALNWRGSTITMYSDFAEGSFFFREDGGICGGLILHRGTHDSMSYSVHT